MAEKKGLHPAIALCLMIVMVAVSLLIGANKAWSERENVVKLGLAEAEEMIMLRVETAYNLSTVARRYVSEGDPLYAALQQDLREMENTDLPLARRGKACDAFLNDAQALLDALKNDDGVQADSRDRMYVMQMLPQAVEQCRNNDDAISAYDKMAQSYNDGLDSFSGWLAQLTNVNRAETFASDEVSVLDSVQ